MPGRKELPSTVKRSSQSAQTTWVKAHDNAVKLYGEGERAHRTAYAALKHSFEKIGDHWVAKSRRGPSDPRSKMPRRQARAGRGKTYQGVDVEGHTKVELLAIAKRVGVTGGSRMTKDELGEAIARANSRKGAARRRSGGTRRPVGPRR